jgi:hypothetical protein
MHTTATLETGKRSEDFAEKIIEIRLIPCSPVGNFETFGKTFCLKLEVVSGVYRFLRNANDILPACTVSQPRR